MKKIQTQRTESETWCSLHFLTERQEYTRKAREVATEEETNNSSQNHRITESQNG